MTKLKIDAISQTSRKNYTLKDITVDWFRISKFPLDCVLRFLIHANMNNKPLRLSLIYYLDQVLHFVILK